MNIFHSIFGIILEALFPSAKADKELFSYNKELVVEMLPVAPASPIISAQSIFAYKNDLVKSLVWNIKYKKSAKAIEIGSYALYLRIIKIAEEIKAKQILLVPIPISHRRKNERGYNQCELLLNKILEFNDISDKSDCKSNIIVCNDLIKRVIHKDRQTLKDRSHRLQDAKNIFEINEEILGQLKEKLEKSDRGFDIPTIVIDDVITTGSTINEAITTLKKAGFNNVRGLSLAH